MDVVEQLAARIVRATRLAYRVELPDSGALIGPSARGRQADFQSSVALKLGKDLSLDSYAVAERLIGELALDDVIGACAVSRPGFLNFMIAREWLEAAAQAMAADERLGVPAAHPPRRVVIDYSAPNVRKRCILGICEARSSATH